MAEEKLRFVPFREAASRVRDGDLLLFRRRNLIAIAGRGEHAHAAKAAWWGDDLFCLEVREWHGGRAVTLSSQVQKFPGRVDVFAANPDNLPVPESHLKLIEHRLNQRNDDPSPTHSAFDVLDQLVLR